METALEGAALVAEIAIGVVLGNLWLMGIVRWRSNKARRDGLRMLQRFEEEMAAAQAEQGQGDGESS